jgi:hypothetical protein
MVVRIRFTKGPKLGQKRQTDRRMALAAGMLLTPAALIALLLAFWRIAADLNWTASFAIPSGLFSHWQVWMACAVLLQLCARMLNRYARSGEAVIPEGSKTVF